jgi:hypothetical protein
MDYEGLPFGRTELKNVMGRYYQDVLEFLSGSAFREVFKELMSIPWSERPRFVERVLLNKEELLRRGVDIPEQILIQVSAFGDRRPTLFVVKKYLPEKYHLVWQNVNVTFFNDFDETDVPSDAASSWRLPLPVSLQQALLAAGVDLNSVPDSFGMNRDIFVENLQPPV